MISQIETVLLDKAANSQSFVVLVLLAIVIILHRGQKENVKLLNEERKGRLDDMQGRIHILEGAVKECETDRRRLWDELIVKRK